MKYRPSYKSEISEYDMHYVALILYPGKAKIIVQTLIIYKRSLFSVYIFKGHG